jgi:hypothetical protein
MDKIRSRMLEFVNDIERDDLFPLSNRDKDTINTIRELIKAPKPAMSTGANILLDRLKKAQSKLDKVRKLAKSKILRRNEDNTIYGTQYITVEEIEKLLEEDLRLEQILKEEIKCINGK